MKKRLSLTLLAGLVLGGLVMADIQSPPGHHFNWSRKLSRGLANLAYGASEIINVWDRSNRSDGAHAAASDMVVEGTKRTIVRLGYGVYEVVTFPFPTYKCTYRPPYYRKEQLDPWWGYSEFSPQVGFISQVDYSRTQGW
ncbi:MAG: exosortase system-associated protein, TIGR04073 family [Verrucomicrobiaceae bacterium]|jgi:putative exosortase-associated protein (TIGR04073 family)|nr:exosortase system-associated protein, TIGR04073 family [Verrucomicrobiaceae bacterium]